MGRPLVPNAATKDPDGLTENPVEAGVEAPRWAQTTLT
jgi:hypothetical protein